MTPNGRPTREVTVASVAGRLVLALMTAALFAGGVLFAQGSGETKIDFALIGGYDYNVDEPYEPAPLKVENTIPAEIRALHGRKVSIFGAAMPLNYTSGTMSEFILNATVDLCGYGANPRINEWIFVTMAGGRKVPVEQAGDMLVRGTFYVEEEVELGRVVGLYRIVADAIK